MQSMPKPKNKRYLESLLLAPVSPGLQVAFDIWCPQDDARMYFLTHNTLPYVLSVRPYPLGVAEAAHHVLVRQCDCMQDAAASTKLC